MARSIFVVQADGTHIPMNEQRYDYERILQEDLEDDADLLAGDQIRPASPLRWLLIAREAGIPARDGGPDHFAVDHLFLDQDGMPTLVEVKRADNTQVRRYVVGQMLDYAANALLYWPVSTIQQKFGERCALKGLDPLQAVVEFVGPEGEPDRFWASVEENLEARRGQGQEGEAGQEVGQEGQVAHRPRPATMASGRDPRGHRACCVLHADQPRIGAAVSASD